ncbi:MAG: type II toxin-antitoxin system VapC family toxin [bacterium]
MSGRYLLDTNIVIALFAGDPSVTQHLKKSVNIIIPSIVLGELYFGAQKSVHKEKNINLIHEFAKECAVYHCDELTAWHYGKIKGKLKIKGTPIPENDLWIASISIQHQIPLVTRDMHFNSIDTLAVIKW